jgi:hypothetical protein
MSMKNRYYSPVYSGMPDIGVAQEKLQFFEVDNNRWSNFESGRPKIAGIKRPHRCHLTVTSIVAAGGPAALCMVLSSPLV